jgi:hypothetical protein
MRNPKARAARKNRRFARCVRTVDRRTAKQAQWLLFAFKRNLDHATRVTAINVRRHEGQAELIPKATEILTEELDKHGSASWVRAAIVRDA